MTQIYNTMCVRCGMDLGFYDPCAACKTHQILHLCDFNQRLTKVSGLQEYARSGGRLQKPELDNSSL